MRCTWSGAGRMKLDAEIVELKEWDAVCVPPSTWRGYEAGPEGPRDPRHRRAQSRRGSARRPRWPARLVGGLAELSRRLIVSVAAQAGARHRSRDLDWASVAPYLWWCSGSSVRHLVHLSVGK